MIRILLGMALLLVIPSCLSTSNSDFETPISVFGWVDDNCIDTARCLPLE